MKRTLHRLSATFVSSARKPGYYADGGGLYLRVAPGGTRAWIFRFAIAGKTRDGGLGSYPSVNLATARAEAHRCRQLVAAGEDPIEARRSAREAVLASSDKAPTFQDCGVAFIASHEAGWKNAKHRQQWANTLKTYVYPVIGALPVAAVDTALVIKVLEPIWRTKPETASRVRGRIESILDWARVRGYRDSELLNPARWRGHLNQLFPSKQRVRPARHHPALPFTQLPAFMSELRKREGVAKRALEFGILTALRSREFREAKWHDINFREKVWTTHVKRTPANPVGEFRVPLSDAAVTLLHRMPRNGGYVFPGQRKDTPISDTAVRNVLRDMGYHRDDATAHGFRSSFRDWVAETTSFPNHVVEMALAHAIPSAVEAAYRRGVLLDQRRRLMQAWGQYFDHPVARVVSLRKGREEHVDRRAEPGEPGRTSSIAPP